MSLQDDKLGLANDKTVINILRFYEQMSLHDPYQHGKEIVVLSSFVTKINRKGKEQKRVLMITNKAVYNLTYRALTKKVLECKRRIKLEDVSRLTVSRVSTEFVIHVGIFYDYQLMAANRKQIIGTLQRIWSKMHGRAIVIKEVNDKTLEDHVVTKPEAFNMSREERLARDLDLRQLVKMEFQRSESVWTDSTERKEEAGQQVAKPKPEDFDIIRVLGRGAFGKVTLVKHKPSKKIFAMKIIKKSRVEKGTNLTHTRTERKILGTLNHPFLVKLRYAFQTDTKLYLVLDYMRGGELYNHLKKAPEKKFTEKQARFFVAEVALALSYLHGKGIIYRDLKPENVVLDEKGHACLTDFGLSKDLGGQSYARTFCGTPEYIAPEIVEQRPHDKTVDWWALGIFAYELLTGSSPFAHTNVQQVYRNIVNKTIRPPAGVSAEAQDFVLQLLSRDARKRLGARRGVLELQHHSWFKGLNWKKLLRKQLTPPFKPNVKSAMDVSGFSSHFTNQAARDTYAKPTILPKDAFDGFTFEENDVEGLAGEAGAKFPKRKKKKQRKHGRALVKSLPPPPPAPHHPRTQKFTKTTSMPNVMVVVRSQPNQQVQKRSPTEKGSRPPARRGLGLPKANKKMPPPPPPQAMPRGHSIDDEYLAPRSFLPGDTIMDMTSYSPVI